MRAAERIELLSEPLWGRAASLGSTDHVVLETTGDTAAIVTVKNAIHSLRAAHLMRNSLDYVTWKDRKLVSLELKMIYRAETAEMAEERLGEFEQSPWGKKYPAIAATWRRHWERITPFFAYPPEVRKVLYTTNAIESLHWRLRKILENRGHFTKR